MTDFAFTERVSDPHADIITAAFHSASGTFSMNDIRKCVKLSAEDSAYELCAAGNEIEGVMWASDPNTVNSGKRLGSVLRGGAPILAQIATDQPTGGEPAAVIPAEVGDYVVAGAGATLNTKQPTLVKTGSPSTFKWRITRIVAGDGDVGSTVLIERV